MKSITLAASLAATLVLASHSARAERAPELPVEFFAQLPQVSSLKLSPNGEYIAMMRPIKGRNHIIIQHRKNKDNFSIIPPHGEVDLKWFMWGGNNRILFSVAYATKNVKTPIMRTRLLSIGRDGKNPISMIKKKRNWNPTSPLAYGGIQSQIQDRVIDFLPDDPKHILLSIDEFWEGIHSVRKIDLETAKFTTVQESHRGIQNWVTDQKGRVRYGWGIDNMGLKSMGTNQNIHRIVLDINGKEINIKNPDFFETNQLISFDANPDIVLMEGWSKEGFRTLFKYNINAENINDIIFDGVDEAFLETVTDPFTGHTVGAIGSKGTHVWFDEEYGILQASLEKAMPGLDVSIISRNTERTLFIVYARSKTNPGQYFAYDRNNRSMYPIIDKYNGLYPENLADVELVRFDARDGLNIPMIITKPKGVDPKKLPTIVMPHGGPHSHSTTSFNYQAQFLANRGYLVLQPNFRGSTGYGKHFEEKGYKQWGLAMQDDVTDATNWAIDQGLSDPNRICIIGGSYGGYAALMGAVKEPNLYKCAGSFNGVSNLPQLVNDQKRYIGGKYMTRHVNSKNTDAVSPYHQSDKINIPILLIAAKDDRTVNFQQSKNMAKTLESANKKVTYVETEMGGHGLDTEPSRITVLTELETFLKENIGH